MKEEETDRLIAVIGRAYPNEDPAVWDREIPGLVDAASPPKNLRSVWHASFALVDLRDAQRAWASWARAKLPKPPTCADLHGLIRTTPRR